MDAIRTSDWSEGDMYGYGYGYGYDMTYLLIAVIGMVLGMITQGYINSKYNKWSQVPTSLPGTGDDGRAAPQRTSSGRPGRSTRHPWSSVRCQWKTL